MSSQSPVSEAELARRLLPYMTAEQAWAIAGWYVDDQLARGWIPPRQPPPKPCRRGDYTRGAAMARELLARRRTDTSQINPPIIERQYDQVER